MGAGRKFHKTQTTSPQYTLEWKRVIEGKVKVFVIGDNKVKNLFINPSLQLGSTAVSHKGIEVFSAAEKYCNAQRNNKPLLRQNPPLCCSCICSVRMKESCFHKNASLSNLTHNPTTLSCRHTVCLLQFHGSDLLCFHLTSTFYI